MTVAATAIVHVTTVKATTINSVKEAIVPDTIAKAVISKISPGLAIIVKEVTSREKATTVPGITEKKDISPAKVDTNKGKAVISLAHDTIAKAAINRRKVVISLAKVASSPVLAMLATILMQSTA